MSPEAVTEILEEVAPANMRGKETGKVSRWLAAMSFRLLSMRTQQYAFHAQLSAVEAGT